MVHRSKEEGGLGVINIRIHNEALLVKHLHKFFNRDDTPWISLVWEKYYESRKLPGNSKKGSFWWRDIIKLLDKFKGIAKVEVKNGKSCQLWEDLWEDDLLKHKFPELYSFAKKKEIVLVDGINQTPIHSLFHLPLSQQTHGQMVQLQWDLENLQLDNTHDKWSYIWSSGNFSVKKTLSML
jgi:hypothetical protein